MNIIIVGIGEIGTHIALNFSNQSHSIIIIESNENIANNLSRNIDARVIIGSGTSNTILIDAEVTNCDLFLALTSDDNANLVSCLIAKELGAKKTICRAHPNLERETLFLNYRNHFNIDYLFSSERLAALEIMKYIRNPDSSMVEEIAGGFVEIQQITISKKSYLINKSLSSIDLPYQVRIGCIKRSGKVIIPSSDDVLMIGDIIILFGEPFKLQEIILKFKNHNKKDKEKNIVIFGGGEYGLSVAQSLERYNCRVRIFESNQDRCLELNEILSDTTILNSDATSLTQMKEENIGKVDFFIAVTSIDEDNVMTCLQAHSLGAKYCLPLIHRADYADAMTGFGEKIGILGAISPREATKKDLTRFITSDKFHLLQKLEEIELIESSVSSKSSIIGKKICDIMWPKDCVLVARIHESQGGVPKAEDIINVEDNLYALVKSKVKNKFLKLLNS